MKHLAVFVVLVCLLAVIITSPSRAYADAWCAIDPAPYQYQQCGTFASANIFTVNSTGLSGGVFAVFQGYHANFADSVLAEVVRNQQVVYTGVESLSNQELQVDQQIPLIPANQLQAGDQVDFVFHARDVNGDQTYYSYFLNSNIDGRNHTWASPLSANQCAPGQQGNCVFMGFEDEYCIQNGLCEWGSDPTEPDYNDFKMWVYGVDATPMANSVPEPSSLLLLTGAPLALAFRKLRNLF